MVRVTGTFVEVPPERIVAVTSDPENVAAVAFRRAKPRMAAVMDVPVPEERGETVVITGKE